MLVMEVLERSLNVERCLCWRMKEEGENFCVYGVLEVAHGRAIWGHGSCQPFGVLWILAWHGQARPCQASGLRGFKNFHFLESYSDNYLQNNLKQ